VERRSWENAAPPLKDPNRVPDALRATCPRRRLVRVCSRRATARSFVPSGEVVMKRSQPTMDEILEAQIQVLATTWRPKTVARE
jgi:hypothetical protein